MLLLVAGSLWGQEKTRPPTVNWVNPGGGNWSSGTNWDTGAPPMPGEAVVIAATGGPYTVTLDSSSPSIAGIVIGGAGAQAELLVEGQTLNVSGPSSIMAMSGLTIRGNMLGGTAQMIINDPTGLSNAGTITLDSSDAGAGATIDINAGPLTNNGNINIQPGMGGPRNLNVELINNGNLTVNQDLTLEKSDAAHLNTGTITLSGGNLTALLTGTGGLFTNNGSFSVIPGNGIFLADGFFDPGTGGLSDGGGSLKRRMPMPGELNLENVNLINNNLIVAASLTVTIADSIVTNTASIDSTGNLLFLGTSRIEGLVNNNGVMRVVGDGAMFGPADLTIDAGSGYLNGGIIELTSDTAAVESRLTVLGGPLLNDGQIESVSNGGGPLFLTATLNNNSLGELQINDDLTIDAADAMHSNDGIFRLQSGTLVVSQSGLNGSLTNNGTFQLANGTRFIINGGGFSPAAGTVQSILQPQPAAVGAMPVMQWDGVTVSGGLYPNPAGFSLLMHGATIAAGATVDNQGRVIVKGQNMVFGDLVNGSPAQIEIFASSGFGFGRLEYNNGSSVTNDGLIRLSSFDSADDASLAVIGGSFINGPSGTVITEMGVGGARFLELELVNQGLLQIDHGTELSPPGAVNHNNTGSINVNTDSLIIKMDPSQSFANNGQIMITPGNSVLVQDGTFHAGSGTVGDGGTLKRGAQTAAKGSNTLFVLEQATLGSGTLVNALDALEMVLDGATIGPGAGLQNNGVLMVIHQTTVDGLLTNNNGAALFIEGDAVNNAELIVNTGFINNGMVELGTDDPGSTARLQVSGGPFKNGIGGVMQSFASVGGPSRTISGDLDNEGTLIVNHDLVIENSNGTHTNDGQIQLINGQLTFRDLDPGPPMSVLDSLGMIQLLAGTDLIFENAELLNNFNGAIHGIVQGEGTVNVVGGSFRNSGEIRPGAPFGALQVTGNFIQETDGVLVMELNGTLPATDFDQFQVSGNADLAGLLDIVLFPGFMPQAGDSFEIITYAANNGNFDAVNGLNLPNNLELVPNFNPGNLTLITESLLAAWNNPAGGAWSNPANWSPPVVPTGLSQVAIGLDGDFEVLLDGPAKIASLTVGGGMGGVQSLRVSGTDLTVQTQTVILSSGELVLENSVFVDPFGVLGKRDSGLLGQPLTIQGRLEGRGASVVEVESLLEPGATCTVRGTDLGGGLPDASLSFLFPLVNDGTMVLTSDQLTADAVLVINGTLFNNGMLISEIGSGGTRILEGSLDNSGMLDLQAPLTVNSSLLPSLCLEKDSHTSALYDFQPSPESELTGVVPDLSGRGPDLFLPGGTAGSGLCGAALYFGAEADPDLQGLIPLLEEHQSWSLEWVVSYGEGTLSPLLREEIWQPLSDAGFSEGMAKTGATSSHLFDSGWHYEALTWDGHRLLQYRDGRTWGVFEGPGSAFPSEGFLFLEDFLFHGGIDSLRLSDAARSRGDILRVWESGRGFPALVKRGPAGETAVLDHWSPEQVRRIWIDGEAAVLEANPAGEWLIRLGDRAAGAEGKLRMLTASGELWFGTPKMEDLGEDLWRLSGQLPLSLGGSGLINSGTIALANDALLTMPTDALTNLANGVIQGNGGLDLANPLLQSGTLVPGLSPGRITINGDAVFSSSAVLDLEIEGTLPVMQFDRLEISGNVTLAGTLNVMLTNGFQPMEGESFNPLIYGSFSGQLDTLNLPPLAGGLIMQPAFTTTEMVLDVVATAMPGDLQFTSITYQVGENQGAAKRLVAIGVERINGSSGNVSVDIDTVDTGSATSGQDYVALSQTIFFGDGETFLNVEVTILDDALVEGDETFQVLLSNPTNGAGLGAVNPATVTILDDDVAMAGQIQFTSLNFLGPENQGQVTIGVERINGSAGIVEVTVQTVDTGSAAANQDFVPVNQVIQFQDGEVFKTLLVNIIDDDVEEGDETLQLLLSNPTNGAQLGPINPTTLTIVDDDFGPAGTLRLGAAAYEVNEGNGFLDVMVQRDGGNNGSVGVTLTTLPGTAQAGSDYQPLSLFVNFGPDETQQTVRIFIVDDDRMEPIEHFDIQLSNPTGGASLVAPSRAGVQIFDNDVVTVAWQVSGQAIDEGNVGKRAANTAVVRARLSSPSPTSVAVPISLGGSAEEGRDFQIDTRLLVFSPNVTTASVSITTRPNNQVGEDKTVVLTLNLGDVAPEGLTRHTVTIRDDDVNQPPETVILDPAPDSIWRVGQQVPFRARAVDPNGDSVEFFWQICATSGSCQNFQGPVLEDIFFSNPGVYEIHCFAQDDQGNMDITPAQTRIRIVRELRPPVAIVEPASRAINVARGAQVSFAGEFPNNLNGEWFFISDPTAKTSGRTFDFLFDQIGDFTLVLRVENDRGLTGSDFRNIRVTEDGRRQAAITIFEPIDLSRINVGDEIDLIGRVSGLNKRMDLRFVWFLGDGRKRQGDIIRKVSYDKPGRYAVRMVAVDPDRQILLEDEVTLFVRDPFGRPVVEFEFPTNLEIQPGGFGKRRGAGELFFRASIVDSMGFEDLTYVWEFEDGRSFRNATPGRLVFEEEGRFKVSLYAVSPTGVRGPTVQRTITVRQSDDARFEPNESFQQASPVSAGRYDNLSLDDDADFYRFRIEKKNQRLVLQVGLDAPVQVEIFNAREERLSSRNLEEDGTIQLRGLDPGYYFIKLIPLPGSSKRGLNYSIGVSVLNPALYFPDIQVNATLESQLGIVNPTNTPASLEIVAYDSQGNLLDTVPLELKGLGRCHLAVSSLFGAQAVDVAWAQVNSTSDLLGYVRTASRDFKEVYAVSASKQLSSELFVPHIAERTDQWFTRASVINGTDQASLSRVETPTSGEDLILDQGFAKDSFDFVDRFGGNITSGSFWAVMTDLNKNAALAGTETFGSFEQRIIAGLQLVEVRQDNPNFTFLGNNLYFTHIARDVRNFWTGIALVNIGRLEQGVRIHGYGPDGSEVGQKTMILQPGQKLVELAEDFLTGIGTPETVDWVLVEADLEVVGFELFGTNDGRRIAGLEASTALRTELCYPFIDPDPDVIHGISVVNVNPTPAQITLTLYDNDGLVLAEVQRDLAANQKLIGTIQELFQAFELQSDQIPGWLGCRSTLPMAGFELFLNFKPNQEQMGAIIAQ